MTEFKQIIEDYIFLIYLALQVKNQKLTNDMKLLEIINLISPGTELRKGLDEMLNGQLGALIVLGTNIVVESVIKGGFKLDIELTPQRLFELSKMDGAIVLSNDLKKIVYANVHLMQIRTVSSTETGIRHRSAEQTAKQSNFACISYISQTKSHFLYSIKIKNMS
jgi:diadenylate cyclase